MGLFIYKQIKGLRMAIEVYQGLQNTGRGKIIHFYELAVPLLDAPFAMEALNSAADNAPHLEGYPCIPKGLEVPLRRIDTFGNAAAELCDVILNGEPGVIFTDKADSEYPRDIYQGMIIGAAIMASEAGRGMPEIVQSHFAIHDR
jgi:hypothetical protein